MPTASFSVRAPISAAARAPPRARITVVARPPCQVTRSSASVPRRRAGRRSPPRSPSASRANRSATASARTPAIASADAPITDERRGEGHRARPRLLAREGLQRRGRRPGRASCPDRSSRRRCAGHRRAPARCSATRTVSALSPDWLTSTRVVARAQHRQAEMQQLGGVDHDRRDAVARRAPSRRGSRRRRSFPCP